NHKQQKTYGVAEKSDDEFTDVFSLSRRMPGWFPDAADPRDDEDYLFPEEVIRHANGIPYPFKLPAIVRPEPHHILGGTIPTKDNAKTPFTFLIRELADKVRWYNITLYELRRFHHCWKFRTKDKDKNKPDPNPYGNQPDLPDWDASTFKGSANTAQANWKKAAKALDDFIDGGAPGHGMPLVAVDMVQVNNYIVSMRVVALQSTTKLQEHVLEAGGSSSSH